MPAWIAKTGERERLLAVGFGCGRKAAVRTGGRRQLGSFGLSGRSWGESSPATEGTGSADLLEQSHAALVLAGSQSAGGKTNPVIDVSERDELGQIGLCFFFGDFAT